MGQLAAAAASIAGEVCLARGDIAPALRHRERAREGFASGGASREIAEVDVALAEAHLAGADLRAAEAAVRRVSELAGALGADDLGARFCLVEARLAAAHGDGAAALERLEQ